MTTDAVERIDARPHLDIDPVVQTTQPCPKCGQAGWKRELRRFDGNESYSLDAGGLVTNRRWFEAYEYLQWTCWPCGYSFDTNTVEDYTRDQAVAPR